MVSLDDIKQRLAQNTKAILEEAKYSTGLEKRPRQMSPYEQGQGKLQKWKRNADYSGPKSPPSPKEIGALVAKMPDGPAHRFNPKARLDASSIVDGGASSEFDEFVAKLNYLAPEMLIPDPLGVHGNYELPAWRSVLEAGKLVPSQERMLEGPKEMPPEQVLKHEFPAMAGRLQKQRRKG